jgi:hypothetical protein
MAVGWFGVETLSFPVRSHEDSEREWNLRFLSLHMIFGTITRRPHLAPMTILWYTFLLENAWKPTKNFHGPYRESNPEPPVLWRSASTNCATARPLNF